MLTYYKLFIVIEYYCIFFLYCIVITYVYKFRFPQSCGSSINKSHWPPCQIPTDLLFQTLKDDAVKVLHSLCQQIWKTQQCPQDWKRSVLTPIPQIGNTKECSNYSTITHLTHQQSNDQNSPSQALTVREP